MFRALGTLVRGFLIIALLGLVAQVASASSANRVAAQSDEIDIRVNFQPEVADTPIYYVRDYGRPFGSRLADEGVGLTYGWVRESDPNTPLDLSANGGNGRERHLVSDQRLDTFMHMQYTGVNGVAENGIWQIEVPNGVYSVTVGLGDAQYINSLHVVNINATYPITFDPEPATKNFIDSTILTVTNNLITVDALGGTNTKINFIDIVTPGAGGLRPYVTATTPTNGATGVECSGSIGADVHLPNVGQGVDASTLTAESVKLYRSLDKAELPVTHGTTGGGDAIVLQSIVPLEPNTNYTFEITNEAEDLSGAAFLPFLMTYTTGACNDGGPGSGIEFEQIVVATGDKYSSLQVGPDGKLYASTIDGRIVRWDINPDGTLANAETITSLQTANGGPRVTTGIAFDPASTAVDLTLYVSNTTFGFNGMPDWGGKITRLSGPNLENVQDLIVNLPRSIRDHVTNGIAFGPDGALYFNQGSNSAMGAPDNAWGNRPERTLSAATLRLDLTTLNSFSLPLDVQTQEGGTYDPFAPGAPLTIFASGVRNAYDLVWHSNGQLYVPTNGSAGGGNAPGTPAVLPAVCQTRVDDAINGDYVGPSVPAALNVEKQNDFLFRIPSGGGGYYGHPNPERCEWVLNGGNPTAVADSNEVLRYIPGTQPDRNYEGDAYNFGFNKSPNGVIEYTSNTFSGALAGKILVVRYSLNDDIIVLDPSGTNGDISGEETNIPGFSGFSDPLELIEGPNGTIYISEYGSDELTLLRPTNITTEPNIVVSPEQLVFDAVVNSGPTAVQSVNIQNTGTADLVISHAYLTGLTPDQFHFVVTPTLPLTVTASSSLSLDFQFDPTAVGVSGAVLQIVSNDTGHPLEDVSLRGLGRVGDGGTDEPSLQWILDTFEIGVDAGDDDPATSEIHSDTSTAKMNTYLGDEVVAQAFRRASAGDVTLQPLAVFAPTSADPITEVGWYASGNPASGTPLFTVGNTPASNGQRLNPAVAGTTSFNPGAATFGFYSRWPVYSDREVFSEDPLNAFGSAIPHHMRVYQLRDETGTAVSNAYVVATESDVSGFDYQDVVYIVRNVEPVVLPGGTLRLENRAWVTLFASQPMPELDHLNRTLTMSRIDTLVTQHLFHDKALLRLYNDNPDDPLTIVDLDISDPLKFTFPNGEDSSLPLIIPPNGFYDLSVQFIASGGGKGLRQETLTILSSDGALPAVVVDLKGAYQPRPEGGEEVTAQQIVNAFNFTTDLGQPLVSDYIASNEEVLSFYWQRADDTKPMYVRQLAALHGCFDAVSFRVEMQGTGTGGGTFPHDDLFCQSFLPAFNNQPDPIARPAEKVYEPIGTFRLRVSTYATNTCEGVPDCVEHGFRLWPIRNAGGDLVPNTYFVIQDYVGNDGCAGGGSGANCDFNDNIYLVSNIEPASEDDRQFDLSVTKTGAPNPATVGQPLTYTIEIANSTIYQAANVVAEDSLPAGMTFGSAVVDNGSCAEASGTVTCNIDAVLGERSNTMTVVVTPTIAGTFINTVTVTAGSFVTTTTETVIAFDPANLPGTVTIIKDAVPNTATPFDFNTTLGSSFSLVDNEQYTPTGPAININFQSGGAAVPTGYLRDYGQAYAMRLSNNQGNGAYRYGWISQDSVGEPTAVPLDMIGNGRDRNIMSDQRLDTTFHMQYNDVGGNSGVLIPGAWEIALPEDLYLVSVTLGDATTPGAAPENYDLSIEGVKVIDDFVPSGGPGDANQFVTAQAAVTVSDGRLTVDAIGGSNTKIVSLSIVPVTADNEAFFTFVFPGTYTVTEQAVPFWELDAISCVDSDGAGTPSTGDVGSATATINVDGGEDVVCTFTNLEGNRPPIIAPVADQFTAEGATLNVSTAVTDSTGDVLTITVSSTPDASSFFTPTVTQNGAGDYTLAIDFAPQVGDMGVYTITMQAEDGVNPAVVSNFLLTVTDDPLASVTVIKDAVPDSDTSFTFSFRRPNNDTTVFALIDAGSPYVTGVTGAYNFQTGSSPDPTGFTGETGVAYGPKANGETYGWLRLADNTPVTASSVTRYRQRTGIPLELDTIIHVQRGDCCASGFTDEIYWEHAVPNGLYEVTVSVGDEPSGSNYDSLHSVRAEGVTLLDQFQATAVEEYTQTVGLVTVSDGRLTIDAVGGTNTKFNYVQFEQLIPASNTQTFTNLLPGGYTVSETIPADWLLTNLVCDDADGSIDLENATASLSLSSGENVTCTFTNEPVPNNVPVIYPVANVTISETASITVSTNITDADGESLVIGVTSDPIAPFIGQVVTENAGGNYTLEMPLAPQLGDAGVYTVTISATDSEITSQISFTVTVDPVVVNLPPVIDALANLTVTENLTDSLTFGVVDGEGDPVTVTLASTPLATGFVTETVTPTGAGSYSVTLDIAPLSGDAGVYTYTVTADDGVTTAVSTTFRLTIEPAIVANTPPVIDPIADQLVTEGQTLTVTVAVTDVDVLDTLSITATVVDNLNTAVAHTFSDAGNGAGELVLPTLIGDAGQVYTATISASDGVNTAVTETFTITVLPGATGSLVGTVALEGNPGYTGELRVNLYQVGAGSGTPTYAFTPTLSASGQFTLTGIVSGTYEVAVKQAQSLQLVEVVSVVAAQANVFDFGTLLIGDINDDNAVNVLDLSLLASAYNTTSLDAAFNALADLNSDNAVDTLDLSLLSMNYGLMGEEPTP